MHIGVTPRLLFLSPSYLFLFRTRTDLLGGESMALLSHRAVDFKMISILYFKLKKFLSAVGYRQVMASSAFYIHPTLVLNIACLSAFSSSCPVLHFFHSFVDPNRVVSSGTILNIFLTSKSDAS